MLPAYLPNPIAALVGGGTPIDLGRNFTDGKRVFGDGKTYRGLIIGIFAGIGNDGYPVLASGVITAIKGRGTAGCPGYVFPGR